MPHFGDHNVSRARGCPPVGLDQRDVGIRFDGTVSGAVARQPAPQPGSRGS